MCGFFYTSGHFTDNSIAGCPGMQFSGPVLVFFMWLLRMLFAVLAAPIAAAATLLLLPLLLLAHRCQCRFARPPLFETESIDGFRASRRVVRRLSQGRVVYKGYLWIHRFLTKLPFAALYIFVWACVAAGMVVAHLLMRGYDSIRGHLAERRGRASGRAPNRQWSGRRRRY